MKMSPVFISEIWSPYIGVQYQRGRSGVLVYLNEWGDLLYQKQLLDPVEQGL